MSLILKHWKLIVSLLLILGILGAFYHYRRTVAENQKLQTAIELKNLELEAAKKNAEIVQRSREIKEKTNHAVKSLDDTAINDQLASHGWLRS